ncbi:hypothetical protein DFH09DRAFT_1373702 [Mycena vulgaris]|nr:hypothetical protein DFH09DRAFT_1373702 [Mycena vulgaris]
MANGKWKDGADSEGAFLLDGEEYEDEEADGEAFALLPAPAAWGTGLKRSVDELEEDDAYAQSHDSRGGTLPKRARTGERVSSPRLAKRRSHSAELDLDDRDAETGSAGSAPKRARMEFVGSPSGSTSTPGTTTASDTDSYDPDRPPYDSAH